MIKNLLLLSVIFLLTGSLPASAGDVKVNKFRFAGPYAVKSPLMVDSVKYDNSKYSEDDLLSANLNMDLLKNASQTVTDALPALEGSMSLGLLQFEIDNKSYIKADIKVGKLKNYKLFVDGQPVAGEVSLRPKTHTVVIKYLSKANDRDSIDVTVSTDKPELISVRDVDSHGNKILSSEVVNLANKTSRLYPSPDGLYYIQVNRQRYADNTSQVVYVLKDTKTNTVRLESALPISWTSKGHDFTYIDSQKDKKILKKVDAQTLLESVIYDAMPAEYATPLPDLRKALVYKSQEGLKIDEDMRMYYHPDDRIPGWRSRTQYELLDFETGLSQPLTFGYRNAWITDLSADSRYALLQVGTECVSNMRPSQVHTLCLLDLQTMKLDTLLSNEGFMSSTALSPDAKQILLVGSPEFHNRIGCVLPDGKYPNMYDYQLYLLDVATKKVTPLTRDFNPSIEEIAWSRVDNKVYFSALDGDLKSLYVMDMKNYKISKIDTPIDYVTSFSVSKESPLIGIAGEGVTDYGKSYWYNTKTSKLSLVEDIHAREMTDYQMPEFKEWNFTNSNGDFIKGIYILPTDFDSSRKYPMIVYYYGGCSPSSRYFSASYSFLSLASQGYVIYILQPRGAAGFGQEFASWHVNTAGDPQCQDIIEGTDKFCNEHPFVDRTKLGCMGASYGGFMTQYLQTKTDMFACAISHAGISNHASYWGFGYWGYSYSQVSMAGEYPWTNKKLFVDNSPLFNVDKIHTPILFLHGTDDRNVPVIESSQMYTALRLLGRETAYVTFKGEGHHVENYTRLCNWQQTIQAWFAKYLKGEDAWWKALYADPKF